MASTHAKPWYRQLWPWLVMLPPIGAICGGLVTVVIAFSNQDSLVDDDYYKEGMAINQSLERDVTAKHLSIKASLTYQAETGELKVELTQAGQTVSDSALKLKLLHISTESKDQEWLLSRDAAGHFRAVLPSQLKGYWYLRLSSMKNDWRLTQKVHFPLSQPLVLQP